MLDLLKLYWLDILIVIFFILGLLALVKIGKIDIVKRIIFALVCKAEKMYGSKTGPIKLAAVWEWLYYRLPLVIRIIFTKKELEGYIEEAVKKLKEILTDKSINLLGSGEEPKVLIMTNSK